MYRYIAYFLIFCANTSFASIDQIKLQIFIYKGLFQFEQMREDDSRYTKINHKFSEALSNTNYLDQTIKKVNIFAGEKPDSFKRDGVVSIHLDDPLWLWVELISNNPSNEAYLSQVRENEQKSTYVPIIGDRYYNLIMQKCLRPESSLPDTFTFYKDDDQIISINYTSDELNLNVSLRASSCVIESFKLEKMGQNDRRYKRIVEIQEDFKILEVNNNPPLVDDYILNKDIRTPVGIIDSGIDYNNPYFQNKMIPGNRSNFPYLALDLAENDYLPYDFFKPNLTVSMRGLDFRIQHHHGSHVSGIAVRDSSELAIIPIRMIEGADGYITDQAFKFEEAISFLKDNGVKCVNMSFGSSDLNTANIIKNVIKNNPDMLFVVAAGNEGKNIEIHPDYPASFKNQNLIKVASIKKDYSFSSDFSNYSNKLVHIAAQGEEVLSYFPGGEVKSLTGTSMAAPQVTRVCGKLHHKYPQWTAIQIKEHILQTAKKLNDLEEYVIDGRVLDQEAALK